MVSQYRLQQSAEIIISRLAFPCVLPTFIEYFLEQRKPFRAISSFRVKTNYQWDNHTVTKADIHYSITNNGTEKVSFTLYVLPSGSDITAAGAGKVQVVDLAPGETRAVVVEDFNQTNATAKNLLSFIQFVPPLLLGNPSGSGRSWPPRPDCQVR